MLANTVYAHGAVIPSGRRTWSTWRLIIDCCAAKAAHGTCPTLWACITTATTCNRRLCIRTRNVHTDSVS